MKKSTTNVLDRENISNDEAIMTVIKNEQVLLSAKVYKFNNYNKQQERVLLLTSRAVYNLLPSGVVNKFMSLLSNTARIKRKIPLEKLQAVTISRFGFEFLLHVLGEYDYRYSSIDFREQILLTLCQAYTQHNKIKKMPCYFLDDMILISYSTTKKDAAKRISRVPKENPEMMDPETLRQAESQKVQAEIIYAKPTDKALVSIDDFQVVKVLGRGAFGKVMLCEHKKTRQVYAIKSLSKDKIIQRDQIEHTKTEREILTRVNHPFIIQLQCAFQSESRLFFVMPFIRGGEIFYHLQKYKRFTEEWAKFYSGCLVLALEYIHELGYAYRDLKPENILINDDGYVILTDFGLAKKIKKGDYSRSFVGTPDYMAPETILNSEAGPDHLGHNQMIDWWSLGIIIYEMLVGIPPFYHETQKKVFEQVLNKEVRFPNSIKLSEEVRDLILKLLVKNPQKRLGAKQGSQELKQHAWFSDIDLTLLHDKKLKPPFIPQIQDKYDVNNFDKEFTSENPYFSMVNQNEQLVKQFDAEFQGMTYQQQM